MRVPVLRRAGGGPLAVVRRGIPFTLTAFGSFMNARVLVIDDEPSVGLLLRYVFDPIHVDVTATRTGADGLRLLRQAEFAAIYVDTSLPDMAGDEVIERARQIRPDVPIVVMTALPRHWVIERTDADAYLHKPFHLAELEESLRVARERAGGLAPPPIGARPEDLTPRA